ncbi:MAG: ABC transporter permease [Promethearchaeota archaeon]
MIIPTSVQFAIKSVLRRRQKNFFAILGITLGVTLLAGVQISVDSLEVEWKNMSLHAGGEREIHITGITNPFFNDSIVDKLKDAQIDHVDGITGRISLKSTVFWEEEGTIETGVVFEGVDPGEADVFGEYETKNGSTIDISAIPDGNIIIGRELVELMETKEGKLKKDETLEISVSRGVDVIVSQKMKIYEIYEEKGRGEENYANNIVVPLDWLQAQIQPFFSQVPGVDSANLINIIYCSLDETVSDDKEVSDAVIEDFFKALETGENGIIAPKRHFFIFNNRITTLDMISSIMSSLSEILWIFGSIVMFCGLLLITNIQLMSVEEREMQTGVMRAIGTKKRQILATFLVEFVILGFVGGFLGIFGGILYAIFLVTMFGIAFGLTTSNPVVSSQALIISFVAGFFVALLTGILPAIRASRVNIVQVIRGIIPLKEEEESRKGLFGGIIMVLIGIFLLIRYEVNILQGQEAFSRLADAEYFYIPVLLIFIGLTLILIFFIRKLIEIPEQSSLQIIAMLLVLWPIINLLVILDWVVETTGGMLWFIFTIFSLIVGTTMLVGLNLNFVADVGELVVGLPKRFKAIALLAFRQIAAQKTRSTLTFAIFASVLTLNIFVAIISHSIRFGFDSQVNEAAAEIDLIALASQDIDKAIDYADKVQSSTSIEHNDAIEFATGMTLTEKTMAFKEQFENESIPFDDRDKYVEPAIIDIDVADLWDNNGEWVFPFDLEREKMGDFNIIADHIDNDEDILKENELTWLGVANNSFVDDNGSIVSSGGKPVVITSFYTMDAMTGEFVSTPMGNSIWLLNSTGTGLIEFKVLAYFWSNPIVDYTILTRDAPGKDELFFVSSEWTDKLYAFTENNQNGTENAFLFKTTYNIKSESNFDLASAIESWSNKEDNEFRTDFSNGRLHGIEVISVWDIYEAYLEGNYRFMQFLQSFTSMGFIVGVLGLLVVSVRSVSERKREIGMMRSIGLTRFGVIIAVIIELVTMGLIGLVIGLFNGCILGYGLVTMFGEGEMSFLIPWAVVGFYTAITLGLAFIAAIIPGWTAQKIPPSEALRYTG